MYKSLPVMLIEFAAWSLRLTEEHRLKAFESTVLSRIYESERQDLYR